MRLPDAYFIFSAVIIGLGFHDAISSLSILLSKSNDCSKTSLWRLAVVVWIFLIAFLICQFLALDYLFRPYPVGDSFFGIVLFMNYFLNLALTFGVGSLLLMRIKVFYGVYSPLFIGMLFQFILVAVFKGLGDSYGAFVAVNVMANPELDYKSDPLYPNSPRYLAIGHSIEAVFACTGSIGFLLAIGKAVGSDTYKILSSIILRYEGFALITIIILNLTIAVFGILISLYDVTYITHVALYLPSWCYSLEMFVFLKNSYHDARTMIETKNKQCLK